MRLAHRVVRALGSVLAPAEERARIERLRASLPRPGFDTLGMHPDWVALGNALADPLYRYYFRVRAEGAHNIPKAGAAILIANHSGTLPFDAAMLCTDVARRTEPPRLLRPIADRFVPRLPWLGTGLSRIGAVSGTMANVRYLLEHGELCLIFPEGLSAIGKLRSERYRLRPFHPGFAELALRHRVPVVPVAIIGPEEQWPVLGHIERLHPFGLPYVPVVASPVPLPVRYHIHYGEPIDLGDAELGAAGLETASDRARAALQALIDRGLAEREGIFR